MNRLKVLVCAASAIFALLSVAGLASASAAGFDAEGSYPVKILGSSGSKWQYLQTETVSSKCSLSLSGELSEAGGAVTTAPTFSLCSTTQGTEDQVLSNGCKYQFTATEAGGIGFKGAVAIVGCNEGIRYSNASGCIINFLPQTARTAEFRLTGTGTARKVEVELNAGGLSIANFSPGWSPCYSDKEGRLSLAVTLEARSLKGLPLGLWIA